MATIKTAHTIAVNSGIPGSRSETIESTVASVRKHRLLFPYVRRAPVNFCTN